MASWTKNGQTIRKYCLVFCRCKNAWDIKCVSVKCAQIQKALLIYLFKIELLGSLREGKITVWLAKESKVWFILSGIKKKSDILRNQDCTVYYPTRSNSTVFFLIIRHCRCGLPKMTSTASLIGFTLCMRLFSNYLTIIPWAWMGSESIAHEGERNHCFSKIQLFGQKCQEKTTLASKTRFSHHCFEASTVR